MSLAGQPRVQLKRVQRRSRRGYASRGPAVSVVACPFSPPRGCDPYSDIKSTHLRRQGRRPKSRLVTASRRPRVSVTCASPHQGAPSGGSVTRCAEEKQRKAAPAPVWKREEWDVHSLVTAALLSEALPKGAGSGGPAAAPVSARGGFCVRRPPPRCSGDDAAVLPGGAPGRAGGGGTVTPPRRPGGGCSGSGVSEHVVSVTSAGQMHSKGLWGRVSLLKTLLWSFLPLGWGLSAFLTRVVAPLRPLWLQARWHRFLPRAPVPVVPLKLVASLGTQASLSGISGDRWTRHREGDQISSLQHSRPCPLTRQHPVLQTV